jgi:capsular exopolysaccharide synthesis family protein
LTAKSGTDALALLNEQVPLPDVILSDIKMPGMDGLAFLQAIRTNPEWCDIPFVFMSAHSTKSKLQQAFEFGADDFLTKPFEFERVLEAIHRASARRQQPVEQPSAVPSAPPASEKTSLVKADSAYALPAQGVSTELRTYLRILWRRKAIILGCTLIAVVLSLLISSQLTPKYAGSATVRISASPDLNMGYGTVSVRLVNTYVEIATSSPVLDELDSRLDGETSPKIEVEVLPDTELLVITATHTDPQVARDSANILATILVERSADLFGGDTPSARELLWEQVQQAETDYNAALDEYNALLVALQEADISDERVAELTQQMEVLSRSVSLRQEMYANVLQRYENSRLNEQLRANSVTIVEPASLPQNPTSPNLILNTGLGLISGLTASIMLAFLLESFDTTLRDVDEIPAITSLPALSLVPRSPYPSPIWSKSKMLPEPETGAVAEAFHELRIRLMLTNGGMSGRTVLVTSPESGTGKTTVSANLALALVKTNQRVVLLDVDPYLSNLYRQLGVSNGPGIYDVLCGNAELDATLQDTIYPNLHAMTLGHIATDVTGAMSTLPMRVLFRKLLRDHDYIVIDAPSVLTHTYTTLLAQISDAVILVVAQNHTERKHLWATLQQFKDIRGPIIGLVANRVPRTHRNRRTIPDHLSEKLQTSISVSKPSTTADKKNLQRTG